MADANVTQPRTAAVADANGDLHELILQSKALTYVLEGQLENSNVGLSKDPDDVRGLLQQQYACIRSLRMHLDLIGDAAGVEHA